MKNKAPVVKQLYRLNIEPKVIDQLGKLAVRTGEPKTRLAARLFSEAVMSFKPNAGRAQGAHPNAGRAQGAHPNKNGAVR